MLVLNACIKCWHYGAGIDCWYQMLVLGAGGGIKCWYWMLVLNACIKCWHYGAGTSRWY